MLQADAKSVTQASLHHGTGLWATGLRGQMRNRGRSDSQCSVHLVSEHLLDASSGSLGANAPCPCRGGQLVMYDFCFTFPYSLFLAFGGLIGFATKSSVPSLLGGFGSAGILAACGYVSLQKYHEGRLCRSVTRIQHLHPCNLPQHPVCALCASERCLHLQLISCTWPARRPATAVSLLVAAGLTIMMYKRYQRTHKIFPAGLTAVLSLAMVGFYVWNLLLFRPPLKRQM